MLRGLLQAFRANHLDRVAESDPAGLENFAGDAEGDVPVAVLVRREAAVGGDRPKRVEIGHPGLRILRRDCTAADVAAEANDGGPDPHAVLDPAILLVRLAAVELEEHSEAPPVHRSTAGVPGELL